MTMTWRARDSRGHYLASKDVHTTLGPEDWDDTCRHQTQPTELRPSAETFGHEPVALDAAIHEAWTRHSACPNCKARTTPTVCARCMEFDANGMWIIPAHPVHWPCTSAIVLGLEPRPCPHCKGNRADPDDPGDWIPEVGMHNPNSAGPCPECNGTGHATAQQP